MNTVPVGVATGEDGRQSRLVFHRRLPDAWRRRIVASQLCYTGLPGSVRVSRARTYSGTAREAVQFRLRDDCPLRCEVPLASSTTQLCNSTMSRPTTPVRQRRTGLGSNKHALAQALQENPGRPVVPMGMYI
jgi:hypothetical protein